LSIKYEACVQNKIIVKEKNKRLRQASKFFFVSFQIV